MGADLYTLSLTIDPQGMVTGSAKSTRALSDIANEAEKTEKRVGAAGRKTADIVDRVGQSLMRWAAMIGITFGAVQFGRIIADAVKMSNEFERLGAIVRRTGDAHGYTAKQLQATEEALLAQSMTMLESRQIMQAMIRANVDLSNASKLAAIAQDVAVQTGMEAGEAMLDLVKAIDTGMDRTLKMAGISLDMGAAVERAAKALGTESSALSEATIQQVRLDAVFKAAVGIQGSYAAALGTTAQQLDEMGDALSDVKILLGDTFGAATNGAVLAFAVAVQDSVRWLKEHPAVLDAIVAGVLAVSAALVTGIGIWAAYTLAAKAAAAAVTIATGGLNLILPAAAAVGVGIGVAAASFANAKSDAESLSPALKELRDDLYEVAMAQKVGGKTLAEDLAAVQEFIKSRENARRTAPATGTSRNTALEQAQDMVRMAEQRLELVGREEAEQKRMQATFDAQNKLIAARRELTGDILNQTERAIQRELEINLQIIDREALLEQEKVLREQTEAAGEALGRKLAQATADSFGASSSPILNAFGTLVEKLLATWMVRFIQPALGAMVGLTPKVNIDPNDPNIANAAVSMGPHQTGKWNAWGAAGAAVAGGLIGHQTGSPAMGALSGAAAGSVFGPWGAAAGAAAGLIGGFLGRAKRLREAARQLETMQRDFMELAGGPESSIASEFRALGDAFRELQEQARAARRSVSQEAVNAKAEAEARLRAQFMTDINDQLAALNGPLGEFQGRLSNLRAEYEENINTARTLGLSQSELARVTELYEAQVESLTAAQEEAIRRNEEDILTRMTAAMGMTEMSDLLRLEAEQRRELAESQVDGLTSAQLATVQYVQALEKEALLKQQAEDRLRRSEDLEVRYLNALGRSADARERSLAFSQRREMFDASGRGASEAEKQLLEILHGLETERVELIETNEEQVRLLEDSVSIAEEQLDELTRLRESLATFRTGLFTSELSTLDPIGKMNAAQSQFDEILAKALAGDTDAAAKFPDIARTLLELTQAVFASGPDYASVFDMVISATESLEELYGDQITEMEEQLAVDKEHLDEAREQTTILGEINAEVLELVEQVQEAQGTQEGMFAELIAALFEAQDQTNAAIDAEIAAIESGLDATLASLDAQIAQADAQWADELARWEESIRIAQQAVDMGQTGAREELQFLMDQKASAEAAWQGMTSGLHQARAQAIIDAQRQIAELEQQRDEYNAGVDRQIAALRELAPAIVDPIVEALRPTTPATPPGMVPWGGNPVINLQGSSTGNAESLAAVANEVRTLGAKLDAIVRVSTGGFMGMHDRQDTTNSNLGQIANEQRNQRFAQDPV